jgi:hypothetical protein
MIEVRDSRSNSPEVKDFIPGRFLLFPKNDGVEVSRNSTGVIIHNRTKSILSLGGDHD